MGLGLSPMRVAPLAGCAASGRWPPGVQCRFVGHYSGRVQSQSPRRPRARLSRAERPGDRAARCRQGEEPRTNRRTRPHLKPPASPCPKTPRGRPQGRPRHARGFGGAEEDHEPATRTARHHLSICFFDHNYDIQVSVYYPVYSRM